MKKFFLLTAVLFSLSIIFFSCSKEEEIIPGIKYTDYPPEELFQNNGNYAEAWRSWIDESDIQKIKESGYGCNSYWNEETQTIQYKDCGTWKRIPARKYWGIMNGIVYLSQSVNWYILSPENASQLRDLIEKKGTVLGSICTGCNTPFGNLPSIVGFE
jgi:hypothetical protein